MQNKLEDYKKGIVPSRKQPGDKMADPRLHDSVWMPWKELASGAESLKLAFVTVILLILAFKFLI